MRVGNQKTTINNKVRAIEQILMLDPVKSKGKLTTCDKNKITSLYQKKK